MSESIPVSQQPLSQRIESLAALEPSPFPVISLYLSLAVNQNGREDYRQFVRKVLSDRAKALPEQSPERESFEKDVDRILRYLDDSGQDGGQALVIFACTGSDLFEPILLEAPIGQHWLFVGSVPHLYPLAQLVENHPRYAAVMLDTNKAKIFVFGVAETERQETVVGTKTRRTSKGGWSQARYQRRAENFHANHIKEVVETLDRIVREEDIDRIVIAGADVAVPLLRDQLPKHLADKIVDIIGPGDRNDDVLEMTMAALREKDAETDIEKVQELKDAWQSGGLGVAGPEATLSAFQLGQVEELIITGSPETLKPVQTLPDDAAPGDVHVDTSVPSGADEKRLKLSDELVTRAQQTSARIRFIEDASLLADIGGVGALLRFRI